MGSRPCAGSASSPGSMAGSGSAARAMSATRPGPSPMRPRSRRCRRNRPSADFQPDRLSRRQLPPRAVAELDPGHGGSSRLGDALCAEGAFRRDREAHRGGRRTSCRSPTPISARPATASRSGSTGSARRSATTSFWEPLDHRHRLGPRTAPNLFVSGWYDFMLDPMLRDYTALVDAGHRPYLTIGPWMHTDLAMLSHGVDETLRWFETPAPRQDRQCCARSRCGSKSTGDVARVRRVAAARCRRPDLAPPPRQGARRRAPPSRGDPTAIATTPPIRRPMSAAPSSPSRGAGAQDQAALEARPDVLTFTSEPLFTDLTIIGQPLRHAVLPARACPTPTSS